MALARLLGEAPHASLVYFQLVDRYRVDHPGAPLWAWINGTGLICSYIDNIIIRSLDKSLFSCPQFAQTVYIEHKMVTCWMDVDLPFRQGSGYWKMNKTTLTCEAFRSRIKLLI